ncbi:MAG TPA: glutamate formimidoyltransferase [Terriglobia bacterium]|nr:glutamate formimidoyltransferase [Terriglobia bacterium]
MQNLIECIPNFSEGRDSGKVREIVRAIVAGPEVYELDVTMDADHNRSVVTFAASAASAGEAALRGIGRAAELIDLNHHRGVHPRIGAADVVPFAPLNGSSLEDCVRIARWTAEEVWRRFRIPTYLYEAAAYRPDRRNLASVRRGQFEGLRAEVRNHPDRYPDFGEAQLHPTAGAIAVGARKLLIACNFNLDTSNVEVAQRIARHIRESSGGLAGVKALGLLLESRKQAQVSVNLTDYEATSLRAVFEAVSGQASTLGVGILETEIVGLIPLAALEGTSPDYLKMRNFTEDLILEHRLAQAHKGAA